MPDEIGHLSRGIIENRTSGAEALSDRMLYGTAEAVPFVQRVSRSLFEGSRAASLGALQRR